MHVDPIARSLELAAARCDDLAPAVYARLLAELPQAAALFRKDARLVQGEMLARVIEALLDFAEGDAWASNFFATEAVSHAGYDVQPEMFTRFLPIVADAVRETLGADWTPDFAAAWRAATDRLNACAQGVAA